MSDWPHASPAADLADDPSIPLLTDRIFLPAVELDTALPASLAGTPASEGGEAAEPIAAEEPITAAEPTAAEEPPAPPPAEPQALPEATPPEGTEAQAIGIADAEAAIEVELDRDLVAASDADFDALLSAEQPLDPTEVAADAAAEPLPAASPPDVHAAVESPTAAAAAAPAFDQAALEAQAEALRAAVLQRLTARLPEQVNVAVRDLMQPAIDQAMAKLGEEAEVALRITLQELVEQALREELARHRGSDAAQ